jgi:hypothetical protein
MNHLNLLHLLVFLRLKLIPVNGQNKLRCLANFETGFADQVLLVLKSYQFKAAILLSFSVSKVELICLNHIFGLVVVLIYQSTVKLIDPLYFEKVCGFTQVFLDPFVGTEITVKSLGLGDGLITTGFCLLGQFLFALSRLENHCFLEELI